MTTTATGKADADKPMEESAERLARPLIKLAKACGVATFYIDQQSDSFIHLKFYILLSINSFLYCE